MQTPRSTSHSRTVESNEALANMMLEFGLLVAGPVGLHLMVYISLLWAWRSWTHASCFILQIFNVMSSEQEASNIPEGSHLIALTSLVCPWKVLTGRSQPSLHTWMHMSVLHEAKVVLFCQSTSRAGAEWKGNCCLASPVWASQIIVVLSTPALKI